MSIDVKTGEVPDQPQHGNKPRCAACQGWRCALTGETIVILLVFVSCLAITGENLIRFDLITITTNITTVTSSKQTGIQVRAESLSDNVTGITTDGAEADGAYTEDVLYEDTRAVDVLDDIFHFTSLGIAAIFLLEVVLKMMPCCRGVFPCKWQVLDSVIVLLTLGVEVAFHFVDLPYRGLYSIKYIVALRLWRVPFVCGIKAQHVRNKIDHDVEIDREEQRMAEEKCARLESMIAQQTDIIRQLDGKLRVLQQDREADRGSGWVTSRDVHHVTTPHLARKQPQGPATQVRRSFLRRSKRKQFRDQEEEETSFADTEDAPVSPSEPRIPGKETQHFQDAHCKKMDAAAPAYQDVYKYSHPVHTSPYDAQYKVINDTNAKHPISGTKFDYQTDSNSFPCDDSYGSVNNKHAPKLVASNHMHQTDPSEYQIKAQTDQYNSPVPQDQVSPGKQNTRPRRKTRRASTSEFVDGNIRLRSSSEKDSAPGDLATPNKEATSKLPPPSFDQTNPGSHTNSSASDASSTSAGNIRRREGGVAAPPEVWSSGLSDESGICVEIPEGIGDSGDDVERCHRNGKNIRRFPSCPEYAFTQKLTLSTDESALIADEEYETGQYLESIHDNLAFVMTPEESLHVLAEFDGSKTYRSEEGIPMTSL